MKTRGIMHITFEALEKVLRMRPGSIRQVVGNPDLNEVVSIIHDDANNNAELVKEGIGIPACNFFAISDAEQA